MNPNQIIDQIKHKVKLAVEHFQSELKSLRTGRASAAMLDGITIDAYGTQMPLNQAATISIPEAQLIQITPFDPNNLKTIADAIRENQSLGLNPSDDGRVVRVTVPPLNEERRRELAKQIGQKKEDCMVRMRGIRHEVLDDINNLKKNKQIGEDDAKRLEKQVDDVMNKAQLEVEAAAKSKETDIMTV